MFKQNTGGARSLAGRVCLVTGGAQGIGWALVRAMAAAGARVYACDHSPHNLACARAESPSGQTINLRQADVTDRPAIEAWVLDVAEETGRIDVLVNNAAFIRWTEVTEMSVEDAILSMRTGYEGMVHTVKAVLPLMHAGGQGNIVNIGSSVGRIYVAGPSAAYAASKAAIEAYTQILRLELADSPVNVTLVRPAVVVGTQFFSDHVASSALPRIADFSPSSTPDRVAKAVIGGILRNRSAVDIPRSLPLAYLLFAVSPGLVQRIVAIGGPARRDFAHHVAANHDRRGTL